MVTIIDNGEEINISDQIAQELIEKEFIYFCEECGFYHIEPNESRNNVILKIL